MSSASPAFRTLALCIGNTSLFGAVFAGARRVSLFRTPTAADFGGAVRGRVDRAVFCSVVPARTESVKGAIRRRFGLAAAQLTVDAPHGLAIDYRRPRELGTDRLAAALGARALHPDRDVVVIDCGTATTITAVTRAAHLAGGAILPGLALWPEMLARRTAQLPRVRPVRPRAALGRTTGEAIAGGVYFGHVGAVRELVRRVSREAFGRRAARALVLGTGGHALLFARENLFTRHVPDLILRGLLDYAARVF